MFNRKIKALIYVMALEWWNVTDKLKLNFTQVKVWGQAVKLLKTKISNSQEKLWKCQISAKCQHKIGCDE